MKRGGSSSARAGKALPTTDTPSTSETFSPRGRQWLPCPTKLKNSREENWRRKRSALSARGRRSLRGDAAFGCSCGGRKKPAPRRRFRRASELSCPEGTKSGGSAYGMPASACGGKDVRSALSPCGARPFGTEYTHDARLGGPPLSFGRRKKTVISCTCRICRVKDGTM